MLIKCLNLSIAFFLILTACHSNENDEHIALEHHLSTSLVENPRSLKDDSTALLQLGQLVFDDTIHDFGIIKEGELVSYEFEFVNKGKKDLLISDAKASCGCTVPSYPQQPIKAGERDKIKITFNSQGKKGYNEKLTIVNTNGNPTIYNLYIRAEVHEK